MRGSLLEVWEADYQTKSKRTESIFWKSKFFLVHMDSAGGRSQRMVASPFVSLVITLATIVAFNSVAGARMVSVVRAPA